MVEAAGRAPKRRGVDGCLVGAGIDELASVLTQRSNSPAVAGEMVGVAEAAVSIRIESTRVEEAVQCPALRICVERCGVAFRRC